MNDSMIIDRGRGPEIRGTRITVYDVMDYYKHGWNCAQISAVFALPPDQIQAAIDYIERHGEEVASKYREILDRHYNYQYSPEVREKLAENRKKLQARLAEIRSRRRMEENHAGDHVGSEH